MTDELRVDSIGRRCPQPVIDLAHAILTIPIGSVVEVLADDPVAAVDIPAWCWTQGHDYLGEPPSAIAPDTDPHAADARARADAGADAGADASADAGADSKDSANSAGTDRVYRYRVRRRI